MGLHDALHPGGELQGQGVGEAAVLFGALEPVQGLPHAVPVGVEEGVVGPGRRLHPSPGKLPPELPEAVSGLLQTPGVFGEGGELLEAALVQEADVPLPEGGLPQGGVVGPGPRLFPHQPPQVLQGLPQGPLEASPPDPFPEGEGRHVGGAQEAVLRLPPALEEVRAREVLPRAQAEAHPEAVRPLLGQAEDAFPGPVQGTLVGRASPGHGGEVPGVLAGRQEGHEPLPGPGVVPLEGEVGVVALQEVPDLGQGLFPEEVLLAGGKDLLRPRQEAVLGRPQGRLPQGLRVLPLRDPDQEHVGDARLGQPLQPRLVLGGREDEVLRPHLLGEGLGGAGGGLGEEAASREEVPGPPGRGDELLHRAQGDSEETFHRSPSLASRIPDFQEPPQGLASPPGPSPVPGESDTPRGRSREPPRPGTPGWSSPRPAGASLSRNGPP